ncbi:hypothetical protein ACKTEK_12385 [Tepidamorphus sp. 3E244]|uniref:hypothetical protein n=1 Tax=Tepidamorphus sp. 3E244 TaxID=3385498 RepID=UPI0038FC2ED2
MTIEPIFRLIAAGLVAVALGQSPVLAQTPDAAAKPDMRIEDGLAEDILADDSAPADEETHAKSEVDALLDALAQAGDAETASRIEQSVLQAWLASGSDTIDLLMSRAVMAMEGKHYPLAMEILDSVIEMKPDYVEAWNKRATLFYLIDDYDRSMRDITATLAIEPRHFGALSGMGLILQEVGQAKGALSAFRQALEVHPFLGNLRENVDELEREVEGEEI